MIIVIPRKIKRTNCIIEKGPFEVVPCPLKENERKAATAVIFFIRGGPSIVFVAAPGGEIQIPERWDFFMPEVPRLARG